MTLDKIFVILLGFFGVITTYWFFFGKKEEKVEAKGSIDIKVEGGYSPSYIIIKKDATTTLNFLRKDPNPCLEEVNIPDFGIKKFLPLNENVPIVITPKKKGEFPYSCGMNMYFGKISVI
ncbi:cupredoxin domain-containing protein [Candidatus Gottesmanbacteria bacterium]|nr:cupredoxin domain-containing protein [Candidatus Gottesmanbacteria bacterium]